MTRSRTLLVALAAAVLLLTSQPASAQPDSKIKMKFAALDDYIHSEDWNTVADVAQGLIDGPEVLLRLPVKGKDGKEVETLVTVRTAANRLLAGLPRGRPGVGLDVYQAKYDKPAADLLAKARKDSDVRLFAEAARRYLYTKSGPDAAEGLATMRLEKGQFALASAAFEELIDRAGLNSLEALTLYNAARAFARGTSKEDKDNRDKVWRQLQIKAPKGLRIDGRDRTLKELEEDLQKPAKEQSTDLADKGRLTLPTDPKKSQRRLDALRDFIKSEDWEAVAALAQVLLDEPKDVFIVVPVKGPDGKEVNTLIAERVFANRLLGTLPEKGREVYEKMHGEKAAALLAKARKESDKQLFADVAQRYLWTKAGPEAAERLATILLDRGDFMAAAQTFDRLINRVGVDKLEPLTLYKAAIAFQRGNSKEDKDNKDKVWKELTRKAPKGLRIDGRDRTLKELEEQLQKPTSIHDWPMFGGTPGRDGQGDGGMPLLQPQMRYSLFLSDDPPSQVRRWIVTEQNSVIKRLETRGEAVIPAFTPVIATVPGRGGKPRTLVIYRDYEGIVARSLETGKREWASASHWSPEGMFKDHRKRRTLVSWVSQFKDGLGSRPSVLIENAAVGTLSSDGQRLYAIDDLQMPPAYEPDTKIAAEIRPGVEANKLFSFDIANGKLFWELGGAKTDDDDPDKPKHDFRDSYFLGPPLPVGDMLYFVNEKDQEIRLVCLDSTKLPARGAGAKELDAAIRWVQPLGRAKEKILVDYGRRINGVQIAYGEGILVCPTNSGVLVGVDALTHDLLWAHAYGPELPKPAPGSPVPAAPPVSEWKASAPVVQGGKVVFALPDGPELRCLSLRDGRLLWGSKRGENDVYLGGVFAGRVVVVGKREVRGLSLDDGKEVWHLATGMPSGRGATSGNVYYLPLKDSAGDNGPGVVAIDLVKGRVIAHTPSRKDPRTGAVEVPGNLVFADGHLVSQSATEIAAYPLLKTKLQEIDETLKKDSPNSPKGLLERGELRRYQGNLLGAVEDFRAALANKPDETLGHQLHRGLFGALIELLRQDFAAGEKYLKEADELSREADYLDDKEAVLRRQATLLFVKGQGYQGQGKVVDALGAYLDLAALKTGDLFETPDDPALKVSALVWARGRIAALYAGAKAPSRQLLDDEIARRWAALRKGTDTGALRAFVAVFALTATGREAQLELAERLMLGDKAAQTEAETLLTQLAAQAADRQKAAQALEALARLMVRQGQLEDAVVYYRRLAADYPTTVIRAGKKGAEYLDDLSTDKRFLPYLEKSPPVGKSRWSADFATANFPPTARDTAYALTPEGEVLPSLRRLRVGDNPNSNHFKLFDSDTGVEKTSEQLTFNFGSFLRRLRDADHPAPDIRLGYRAVGRIAVVNLGERVLACDTFGHRVLWVRSLVSAGADAEFRIDPRDGGLTLFFPDGTSARLAQLGPVGPGFVALLTEDGLSAVDLLTGRTLWQRRDVPPRAVIFGDGEHVFAVDRAANGKPVSTRAFRTQDGAAVKVTDFAAAFEHRLRTVGGELLVAEKPPAGGLLLRLYDVAAGKDVWSEKFAEGSVVMRSHDPDLAGVIAPGGHVTFVSLGQRKVVLSSFVDAAHMKDLKEAHLLADADQVYVAFDTTNPNGTVESNLKAESGLRGITVNGEMYAFDRHSGKIRWHTEIRNQQLVLQQWQDLPVLLFTARYVGQSDKPPRAVYMEAYGKTVGKLFFKLPAAGAANPIPGTSGPIYAVHYDRRNGKIEMIADAYKVTITREAGSAP
jgi:outer membrane protein assembly factor BamB